MSPCFSHVFLAFYVHFHSFLPVCTCVCVCVSIHYASDCVHLFSVCAGCKGRFRQGEMSKGLVTVIAYVCVGVWPGSWHTTIFPSLNRPPSYCFPDTNFPLPTRNERQVTTDWLAPIQFGPLHLHIEKRRRGWDLNDPRLLVGDGRHDDADVDEWNNRWAETASTASMAINLEMMDDPCENGLAASLYILELESLEMDFFGLLTAPPVTNPVTFIREHLEKLSLNSSQ